MRYLRLCASFLLIVACVAPNKDEASSLVQQGLSILQNDSLESRGYQLYHPNGMENCYVFSLGGVVSENPHIQEVKVHCNAWYKYPYQALALRPVKVKQVVQLYCKGFMGDACIAFP